MTQPFPVACPACSSRFMVSNPQLIGKQVACPKCRVPFPIPAPQAAAPARPAQSRPASPPPAAVPPASIPDDDPLGLGDAGSWESDPLGSVADDPLGSPGGSTLASPRRRPTKRRSNPADLLKNPLLWMGVGSVAVLLLIFALIYNFSGGGGTYGGGSSAGNVVNMAWLPAQTEAVGYIDLQAALQSPTVKELRSNPIFQQQIAEFEEQAGMRLDDLRSVTFGLPAAANSGGDTPFDSQGMVAVVRMDAVPQFTEATGFTSSEHGGKAFYLAPDNSMGFYMPDGQTMVVAPEAAIRGVIDSGGNDPRRPEFDFIKKGQDAFFAWAPSNRTALTSNVEDASIPPGAPPQIQQSMEEVQGILQNDLQAVGLGGQMGSSEWQIVIQAVCGSRDSASRLVSSLQPIITEAKQQASQSSPMMPPAMKQQIEGALNSLRVSSSGGTAELTVSVPQTEGQSGTAAMFLLPAIRAAREAARRAQASGSSARTPSRGFGGAAGDAASRNNLRQIGIALHNHHDVYKKFPPADRPEWKDAGGKPLLSWRVHILPFLEHKPLYDQFHLNEPWDSPHNRALLTQMPDVFKSSSGVRPGHTTYLAVSGPDTVFENGDGRHMRDIVDGSSNTAMVVQVEDTRAVPWTQPSEFEYNAGNPATGLNSAGFLVLFSDGSVRTMANMTAANLLKLFRRNDGSPEF